MTVELQLAVDLGEIEGVAEQGVHRVARDEHLDGIAIDRQARKLLGVLGVGQIVDEQAAVGIEIEEPVVVDAVDVGFLDCGIAAARGTRSRSLAGVSGLGPACDRGNRKPIGHSEGLAWTAPGLLGGELGLARGQLARVADVPWV